MSLPTLTMESHINDDQGNWYFIPCRDIPGFGL